MYGKLVAIIFPAFLLGGILTHVKGEASSYNGNAPMIEINLKALDYLKQRVPASQQPRFQPIQPIPKVQEKAPTVVHPPQTGWQNIEVQPRVEPPKRNIFVRIGHKLTSGVKQVARVAVSPLTKITKKKNAHKVVNNVVSQPFTTSRENQQSEVSVVNNSANQIAASREVYSKVDPILYDTKTLPIESVPFETDLVKRSAAKQVSPSTINRGGFFDNEDEHEARFFDQFLASEEVPAVRDNLFVEPKTNTVVSDMKAKEELQDKPLRTDANIAPRSITPVVVATEPFVSNHNATILSPADEGVRESNQIVDIEEPKKKGLLSGTKSLAHKSVSWIPFVGKKKQPDVSTAMLREVPQRAVTRAKQNSNSDSPFAAIPPLFDVEESNAPVIQKGRGVITSQKKRFNANAPITHSTNPTNTMNRNFQEKDFFDSRPISQVDQPSVSSPNVGTIADIFKEGQDEKKARPIKQSREEIIAQAEVIELVDAPIGTTSAKTLSSKSSQPQAVTLVTPHTSQRTISSQHRSNDSFLQELESATSLINDAAAPAAPLIAKKVMDKPTILPSTSKRKMGVKKTASIKPTVGNIEKSMPLKPIQSTPQPLMKKQPILTPKKAAVVPKTIETPRVVEAPIPEVEETQSIKDILADETNIEIAALRPVNEDMIAPAASAFHFEPEANGFLFSLGYKQAETIVPVTANVNITSLKQFANENPQGRIKITSYASDADATGAARRLSLQRAISLRKEMIQQGINGSRIVVQALGDNTDDPIKDRVDVFFLSGS